MVHSKTATVNMAIELQSFNYNVDNIIAEIKFFDRSNSFLLPLQIIKTIRHPFTKILTVPLNSSNLVFDEY